MKKEVKNMAKKASIPICNADCFNCIYPDCITDVLPKERERKRLYYQNHKEQKKAYDKERRRKIKEQAKNAESKI